MSDCEVCGGGLGPQFCPMCRRVRDNRLAAEFADLERRAEKLKPLAAKVMGRFDARCEVLRTALDGLIRPMRVNALTKVLAEMLTDEEWEDLEWHCQRRKRNTDSTGNKE